MPPDQGRAHDGFQPDPRGGVGWFVLNLDRSPDRLAAIARDLETLGISPIRVPAVDGRALSLPLPGIDPGLYLGTHGRELLLGEVGCYLSHLRALRLFLASGFAHAMVLEDDAAVTPRAPALVEALTAAGAPDDWDLVKFEAHHGALGLPLRRLSPGGRLCALPHRSAGSAAYLVNRAAATALLGRLLPIRMPYDIAFDRGWDLGLRVRGILPYPVAARPSAPTIVRDGRPAARKRSPLRWRAATRAMRLLSALHSRAAPARAFPWRTAGPPGSEHLFEAVERVLAERGAP